MSEYTAGMTFTPKQQVYLSSRAHFLLYGGAAGGGKTHVAIMDMLGLNNPGDGMRAIDFPYYQGLILRRTMPEIKDVIERSKQLYPKYGRCEKTGKAPTWSEKHGMWFFPSGAKIRMGFLERDDDWLRYQGWEYQRICFEELTHWSTNRPFMNLNGRLRKPKDSPIQIGMRATTNPGGVGHAWVRKFWQISDDGEPTRFSVPMEVEINDVVHTVNAERQFIPALLDDNPYVDQVAYAAALEDPMMSEQMKRAMRFGRWDVVDLRGLAYSEQLNGLNAGDHIRDVPYNPLHPVNTFWDLGVADKVAVWFHQRINGVDYFIDYYEANNRGLKDHWIELTSRGYNYGCHFLPHDANARKHNLEGAIMTIVEIFEALGMRNIQVVPRTYYLAQAIEQVRTVLPRCYFDRYKTERGLECLTNYGFPVKSDGSLGGTPRHDQFSHGADAYRQFAQAFSLIDDAIDEFSSARDSEDVPDVPHARKNRGPNRDRPQRWVV